MKLASLCAGVLSWSLLIVGTGGDCQAVGQSAATLAAKSSVKRATTALTVKVGSKGSQAAMSRPLSQINTVQSITKGLVYDRDYLTVSFLGFTAKNEALYLLNNVKQGKFFWFDTATGKLLRTIATTAFDFDDLRLSSDGKTIFTTDSGSFPRKKLYLNELIILDAENLRQLKTINNKPRVGIFNPCFINGDRNKIALPVLESTWDTRLKDYAGDPDRGARIEIWNWTTGQQLKAIPYAHAPGVADIVFSPDGKYITCFFKNMRENRFNGIGILDILEAGTGKILWHIEGSAAQPVSFPVAFISSTRLMCPTVMYDVATHLVQPLFSAGDRRLKFVGGVPGQQTKVLILTKGGLELWNWQTQRILHRWPTIIQADAVRFAPDLKVIAVEVANKSLTQFWKFDPQWVR